MDNLEIIFKDFPKIYLDEFVSCELLTDKNVIKDSHFYDNFREKDLKIEEISALSEILSLTGCGSITFSIFEFGITLKNTVVTFSFNEKIGDITINFEINSIPLEDRTVGLKRFKNIIEKVLEIKKKYSLPIVFVGLEPADNDDTCLLRLNSDKIDLRRAIEKIEKALF